MDSDRHFAQSFDELRNDLKGFIETRFEILRVEVRSGIKRAQSAVVLFVSAAIFAFVGLILLGACAALAIGLAFGAFTSEVGLIWGFLIAGVAIVIIAGITGMAGRAKLKTARLRPERTLRVLKRDQETIRQQVARPMTMRQEAKTEGGQKYAESERIGRRA